jgi:PKD repeat protein
VIIICYKKTGDPSGVVKKATESPVTGRDRQKKSGHPVGDSLKKAPAIAVLLVSLFLIVSGAAASTVQVQNGQVNTIGSNATINLTLDSSSAGLAGYDITVALSNASVATIINASFPSWAILNESTTLPASSVRLRAVDLYERVSAGATTIPFGNITLRGDKAGSTDVIVTVKNITADDGTSVTPSTQSGSFIVSSGGSTPPPPASPVKLIFIHHSSGQNWLDDGNGALGIALENNNYFVSDTNYGWGPTYAGGTDHIGDHTDIGNWYDWFRGPDSATYLAALYAESGEHSSYSRLATDPGGKNTIVMFKSCFPNSALKGNPDDPVPPIASNPMKSQSAGADSYTVANAKGIYIDLLNYFATKQDTLFIVITAPPLIDGTYGNNARAFNQWLVNDWLKNYPYKNVYVFDFYNVLTTNGGNANTNDLGAATGNHHRWWNGAVQHQVIMGFNTTAYPTGDDHPSQAGNLKATAEYLPLLNYAYNQWTGSTVQSPVASFTGTPRSGTAPLTVQFNDTSTGSPISWNWSFGDGSLSTSRNASHSYPNAGTFTVSLNVTNAAGVSNLTVKTGYITVTTGGALSKTGVYRNGIWYLDYNGNGVWDGPIDDRTYNFGGPGNVSVVGDWNGDGKTEIGVTNGVDWYLDTNGNGKWDGTGTGGDQHGYFGIAGYTPIVGDWNGDHKTEIGVTNGLDWYLDTNGNGVWDGTGPGGDQHGYFGIPPSYKPITGDWNGDGRTEIGVTNGVDWYLDMNGNGKWDGTGTGGDQHGFFGITGYTPIVGDWNGDHKTEIGVTNGLDWYLDTNGNGAWDGTGSGEDQHGYFGIPPSYLPITGDWNGDGKDKIGVTNDVNWYLDASGNGVWDGTPADKAPYFGIAGWTPVVGKWG